MCARAARLLGEGDQQRERAQRERLERTLTTLLGAPGDERLRVRAEAAWQTRFEDLLEDAERSGRQVQLAAESRQLVSVCAGAYAMAKPVGASAGNLTSPGPSALRPRSSAPRPPWRSPPGRSSAARAPARHNWPRTSCGASGMRGPSTWWCE
ncbi:hypothetical protein [Streptomyces sp. NPDC002550]